MAYANSMYGSMGQRALYETGMTGIPVMTVMNACATGSSALFLARQAVRGGLADCALALGMEKMKKGSSAPASASPRSPSSTTTCAP